MTAACSCHLHVLQVLASLTDVAARSKGTIPPCPSYPSRSAGMENTSAGSGDKHYRMPQHFRDQPCRPMQSLSSAPKCLQENRI